MIKKYSTEILILLLFQCIFLTVQLFLQNFLHEDSFDYIRMADNIIGEKTFYSGEVGAAFNMAYFTKIMPVYPILLAIIKLFSEGYIFIICLQLLISMGSFLLLLKIFRPEKTQKLFILFFIILFPSQFIYSNLILPEILLQFVLMLAVLTFNSYIDSKRVGFLWFYQSLIILSVLIKPEFHLFIYLNIILFAVLYYKSRQRLIVISSLIPLVFLAILGGINQQRTGYFHISSNNQIDKMEETLHAFTKSRQGTEKATEIRLDIARNCDKYEDLKTRSRCYYSMTYKSVKENIFSYTVFRAKHFINFFLDPGKNDLIEFFEIESQSNLKKRNSISEGEKDKLFNQPLFLAFILLIISSVSVLRFLGFIFFLFNKSIMLEFRLFLFMLIGLFSTTSIEMGSSQNIIPVLLLLSGAAMIQFSKWTDYLINRKKLRKISS